MARCPAAPGGQSDHQSRRPDRYATKGNGVIIPALLAVNSFGHDAALAPYAFDPVLQEAGYPDGLAVTLIAPSALESRPPWSARC